MSEEWKNWRIIYGNIREDSHHAEWVDITTGEVVKDNTIHNDMEYSENYYKSRVIRRNDIGDAFCSKDYSK